LDPWCSLDDNLGGIWRERAPMLEGDTPLVDAARHARLADVAGLLSGDADVNEPKTDGSGATALCIAAQEGHMEVVAALLAAGAIVHAAEGARPALQFAAAHGHLEVVAALLAAGARVNEAGDEGATPLLVAAYQGHTKVVSALLAAGAEVGPIAQDPGNHAAAGWVTKTTPLHLAANQGHVEVVVALLAAGAHVDVAQLNEATPLFVASQKGHVEILAALLTAGARVDGTKRSDRATPLLAASENGHAGVVSALLAAGAEVDPISHQGPEGNEASETPLFAACLEGHAEVVSALVNAGASIDWTSPNDQLTPLMVAAEQGEVEVLTVLLEAGAAVNHTDIDGDTAMSLSCGWNRLTCVQILSSYGATRTFPTPHGEFTVEKIATDNGHEALAAFLVESRRWSTPLHHLRIIGAARAREQLRGGADLHAAAAAGGPTPRSLAQALRAAGDAAPGSAVSLVLAAAEPWGPRTHSLFPAAARTFAAELLLIGHQLSRQPRFAGEEISLVDVWTQLVMPSAVVR